MTQITNVKTLDNKLDNRGKIKLPVAVLEELGLSRGSKLSVLWGKTYQCVVIIPVDAQLGSIMRERIEKICNEPLKTER